MHDRARLRRSLAGQSAPASKIYKQIETEYHIGTGDADITKERIIADGTDYLQYPMITANYPYLISFPGKTYYEFDCSGAFYSECTGDGATDPDPQIITFAWDSDKAQPAEGSMQIGVTDASLVSFSHDGKQFVGTYRKLTASLTDAVVDLDEGASKLIHPTGSEERILYPFRAYMKGSGALPAPLKISTHGIDIIGDPQQEEENLDEDAAKALQFYLEGRELVVENPFDCDLTAPLCDVAGRVLRILDIAPGTNRYGNLDQGIYLVGNFKFFIR